MWPDRSDSSSQVDILTNSNQFSEVSSHYQVHGYTID